MKVPTVVPSIPMQFIHEDDVGRALLLCTVGAGEPGAYNIAADDTLTLADVAAEIGLLPLPIPADPAHALARLASKLPLLPSSAQWVEAASHPAVMDTSKARSVLGWQPLVSARQAIRDSLGD